MRFTLSVVLAMAAAVLAADPIVVDTPTSVPQCGDTVAQWTGGTPPYNLQINFDRTFESRHDITGHSSTYFTHLPAGTVVFFSVTDSAGQSGRSADFVVQPTDNSSCL